MNGQSQRFLDRGRVPAAQGETKRYFSKSLYAFLQRGAQHISQLCPGGHGNGNGFRKGHHITIRRLQAQGVSGQWRKLLNSEFDFFPQDGSDHVDKILSPGGAWRKQAGIPGRVDGKKIDRVSLI